MRRQLLAAALSLAGLAGGAHARPRPSIGAYQDRSTVLNSLLDKHVDRPWEVTVAGNGTVKTLTLDDLSAVRVRIVIPF